MKVERESQYSTAGGSEFQVRGAAVLNDRLANDARRNGTHSSGTDDDRVFAHAAGKVEGLGLTLLGWDSPRKRPIRLRTKSLQNTRTYKNRLKVTSIVKRCAFILYLRFTLSSKCKTVVTVIIIIIIIIGIKVLYVLAFSYLGVHFYDRIGF